MTTHDSSVTATLGEAYHSLSIDDVEDETRETVKRAILDVLGNTMAGVQESHHPKLVEAVRTGSGTNGEATVVGTRGGTMAEKAVFGNAATAHIVVQDDAHRSSGTHPGTIVIPTAFAVGEVTESSGAELLTAIVAGYDIVGRLGSVRRGFNDELPRRPTPVFGPFGAALAAGKLMDLDPVGLASALGFAANLASGTSQTWVAGTDEYILHCGFAARHGVAAARLAETGLTAAPQALEGDYGFYRAFFGDVPPKLAEVTADVGESFELTDVYAKAEPACGLAIAPIQLAQGITTAAQTTAGVEAVEIRVSDRAAKVPGVLYSGPFDTPTQALMSIPFGVACTLTHGEYSRRACRDLHNDPDVSSLADQISVTTDDEYGKYRCKLTVRFTDGTTVTRRCTNVDEPTDSDIVEKFRRNATAVLDANCVDEVEEAVAQLDTDVENVRTVVRRFRPPASV